MSYLLPLSLTWRKQQSICCRRQYTQEHSCHPKRPRQVGEVGQQEFCICPWQSSQSAALGKEKFLAAIQAGHWLAGKQHGWKRPRDAGRQWEEHEQCTLTAKMKDGLGCRNKENSQETKRICYPLSIVPSVLSHISTHWTTCRTPHPFLGFPVQDRHGKTGVQQRAKDAQGTAAPGL